MRSRRRWALEGTCVALNVYTRYYHIPVRGCIGACRSTGVNIVHCARWVPADRPPSSFDFTEANAPTLLPSTAHIHFRLVSTTSFLHCRVAHIRYSDERAAEDAAIRARSGPNSLHPVPRTNCPRVPYPVWCSTYFEINIRVGAPLDLCPTRRDDDSRRRCARRVRTRGRGAMHPTTHPFVRTQCHRRFAN